MLLDNTQTGRDATEGVELMDVNSEELSQIISDTIKKSLADERAEFRVPPRQHFLDHEQMHSCKEAMEVWVANHDFITPIRTNVTAVKNSFFKSLIKLIGIGVIIAAGFTYAKIKGLMGQ